MLGAACGDDEPPGRPVEIDEFRLGECKANSSPLLTERDPKDYDGLECLAWDFSSKHYIIELINRPGTCGFSGSDEDPTLWTPAVRQLSDSRVEFDVEWKFEGGNACLGCFSDFSVRLDDIALQGNVRVDIATRGCTAKECGWQRDTLAVGDEAAGIRCRYTVWSDESGTARLEPDNGTCDDDLVVYKLDDGSTRCMRSCTNDDACSEVESCRDGVCQLRDVW
jgi:hypothetical protein